MTTEIKNKAMQYKLKIPVTEFLANGVIEPGREMFARDQNDNTEFISMGKFVSIQENVFWLTFGYGVFMAEKSILYIEVEAKPIYK